MANMSGFQLKEPLAAPFIPLDSDGKINLSVIQGYADYLVKAHFTGIFINGSCVEGMSITLDERKSLAEEWKKASNDRLQLVVHVGVNANKDKQELKELVKDARELARHAEEIGADAIAAFAPLHYIPENEEAMVGVMKQIAGVAPNTPFYYYDINFNLVGLYINGKEFMELAKDRIPNWASRSLPSAYCTLIDEGHLQVPVGSNEEENLSFLTSGTPGTVIVSYLGPLFYELRKAFDAGDLNNARDKQIPCRKLQSILRKCDGGMSAAKSIFKELTKIDVGPVRLPLIQLDDKEIKNMQQFIKDRGLENIASPKDAIPVKGDN